MDEPKIPIVEKIKAMDEALKLANTPEEAADIYDKTGKFLNEQEMRAGPENIDDFIALVESKSNELFHDEKKRAYASIRGNDNNMVYPIASSYFSNWVNCLHYRECGRPLSEQALKSILGVLTAKALFDGKIRKMHVRVAWIDDAIVYDMTNEGWDGVKITADGWKMVKLPLGFIRYEHQRPQVMPATDADDKDIELFRTFMPLSSDDNWKLRKIKLVTDFIPGIPHPIDAPYGDAGSAKTTSERMKKSLIDPSELEVIAIPRNPDDMDIIFQHHHYVPFDNISKLTKEQSDKICRACSGTAMTKRRLYTDEDEHINKFQNAISLNGINPVPQEPDALDRSLLHESRRIPREKRRTEKDLFSDFEVKKPRILGAIFNKLSKAMQIYPTVKIPELQRMADFTLWGEAVSQAFGNEPGEFLRLYDKNIKIQNQEAIGASTLGEQILLLMNGKKEGETWEGTPTQLLEELIKKSAALKIDTKSKGFPKAPNSLMRKINEIKVNLSEAGISYETDKSGNRKVILKRIERKNSAQTDLSSKPHSNPPKTQEMAGDIMDEKEKGIVQDTVLGDIRNTVHIPSSQKKCLNEELSQNGQLDDMDDTLERDDKHTPTPAHSLDEIIPQGRDVTWAEIEAHFSSFEKASAWLMKQLGAGSVYECRIGVYRSLI